MIANILIKFLTFLFIFNCLNADFSISDGFQLNLANTKFGLKYFVETKHGIIGIIYRKMFCYSYELIDKEGRLLAYAIHLSEGDHHRFEIRDEEGGLLGFFEEPPYMVIPEFNIFSKDGELLAKANSNFTRTRYYIIEPFMEVRIAKLSRDICGDDTWCSELEIPELFDSNYIDPRLFALTVAIQSDSKTWRKL